MANNEERIKTLNKKFTVGEGLKSDSVEATIEDGLLTVYIPNFKKQERKKINIQ